MSNPKRYIGTDDLKITELVKLLQEDKLLIPTFQREFVWEPANILKLWDSIFHFYPIGSVLYWETDSYLHTHRRLGGFVFPHDEDTVRKFKEWQYILDGQQRATSLLVSYVGGRGKVQENEDFDYTLYFDASTAQFFFAGDLPRRKSRVPAELLIRVRDVPEWDFSFYKDISAAPGFNSTVEGNLQQLSRIFSDYRIPVVRIRGVEVAEVCEIFERINQEGKKLDPVDIIVARTYRHEDPAAGQPGFYLRDHLRSLTELLTDQGSRFQELDDLTVIQMVAICLRKEDKSKRSPFGITPAALDNLTAEHFERGWAECQRSILETIKFLTDLKVCGPSMVPFSYLALPLCYYFHKNRSADRNLARQWFWRQAFGLEDFRASTDVYEFCEEFFGALERGQRVPIEPLTISQSRLIQASYNYRNSLSRAVLAFLASRNPLDFSDPNAAVLDNVYLLLSHSPNLHHIYPLNFLRNVQGLPAGTSPDSLMNICFLRAKTNIQVGDKNPLTYFRDFSSAPKFDRILQSHLIPHEYVDRESFAPSDYGEFLRSRAQWFAESLRSELPDVPVTITD